MILRYLVKRICSFLPLQTTMLPTLTALRTMRPPFIIMAGSGMCNGGRILGHLEHFITKPETVVMFVGWQSRGSLGRALVDGEKQVQINGKTLPVAAHIATLNGFSAHADRKGLLSWA
jgi:metallo-beta-lactamase family protein